MNKIPLKIGLVILPMAIWWGFSIFVVMHVTKFLIDHVERPESGMIQFSYGTEFSLLNIMPAVSFVVLGLATYLSIKLWIKYIHNQK